MVGKKTKQPWEGAELDVQFINHNSGSWNIQIQASDPPRYHLNRMWAQVCSIYVLVEGIEFVVIQSCPFFGGAIVIVTKDVSEAYRLLE